MGNIIIKLSEIYAKLNNVITKTSTDEGFLKSNGNKDSSGRLFTNTESNKLNNTIEKTSTDNGFLKSNGSIDSSTYNYYTHPRPFTFNSSLPQTNDTQTYHSSAQSPSFGGPFNIPSITVDGSGHINKIMSAHVTLPSLPNASSSTSGVAKAYNGTTTAIGSAASNGTDNGIYARGDHKHNITKQTVTDLGIPDNNHKHDGTYLKLSGGALTGALSSNSNIGTSATVYGNKIMKNGGSSTQVLLADGSIKNVSDFATNDHKHQTWEQTLTRNFKDSTTDVTCNFFTNSSIGLGYVEISGHIKFKDEKQINSSTMDAFSEPLYSIRMPIHPTGKITLDLHQETSNGITSFVTKINSQQLAAVPTEWVNVSGSMVYPC